MTTQLHPVLLAASKAALMVVDIIELLLLMVEEVLTLVIGLVDSFGNAVARSAKEKELERKRREEFIWRARETAKANRDFGPLSRGFFSGLFSLFAWILMLFLFGAMIHWALA